VGVDEDVGWSADEVCAPSLQSYTKLHPSTMMTSTMKTTVKKMMLNQQPSLNPAPRR
jgi:hypothetical protein